MQTLDTIAPQTDAVIEAAGTPCVPRAVRMAYLLSQYPAVSHTFLLHEVLGLRARGLHIETASINRPDRPLKELPPAESAEAETTYYIKHGQWLASLFTLLAIVLSHPAVVFRGLAGVRHLRELTLRKRMLWLFYLAEALMLGRWMRERKLRHLHVHFGGPVASVGMLTALAWKIPYSLTIHGPEELLNVDAYQLREKIQQASFVICISDFCRSQLCQLTPPATWSKFFVVRLGVDPVTLMPPSRDLSEASESQPLHLVCTGRLVPEKGHHILLQAIELLRTRGTRLRTTLIGRGPQRSSLEYFVRRHGLEDSVHFTSALSHQETLNYVRTADIFALASFAEGIPVALMEAMALGVPCVSTTIAGIPELIRSGESGLLVAPSNVVELADALELLATDAGLRTQMGVAARERILSNYNLPLNHEHLAQHFQQHLSSKSFTERAR